MPKDDPLAPAAPVPPPAAAPVPGRWTRVALVVSLAVNLAVAGVAAGVALRGGPPEAAGRDPGFGPFAGALSPEDRAALRAAYLARARAEGDGLGAGRRALRQDMTATLQTLRADPFDPAAFRAALDQMSDRLSGRVDLGMTLIYDRVVTLSEAERLAFADRLAEGLRRGPRGRRDRTSDP